jgi:mono/diheme cytochrome c family protein
MNSQKARRVALACAVLAAAVTASAQNPASAPAAATGASAAAASPGGKPYKVVDGFYVDDFTLEGFHAWRAAACDRCHGANQQGLVGPSLIDSLKTLTKADFVTTVTNGRLEKGMPSWSASKNVMDHIDQLYAYLKGRSDGAITQAHVQPMAQAPSASAAAK